MKIFCIIAVFALLIASIILIIHQENGAEISDNTIPITSVGEKFEFSFEAQKGFKPYYWKISDVSKIPHGLKFDNTGILSGIPEKAGEYIFELQLCDNSNKITSKKFKLIVNEKLSILSKDIDNTFINSNYYLKTLEASGGHPPYEWNIISGLLPEGIELSKHGQLSGKIPPNLNGSYNIIVEVSDFNKNRIRKNFQVDFFPDIKRKSLTASRNHNKSDRIVMRINEQEISLRDLREIEKEIKAWSKELNKMGIETRSVPIQLGGSQKIKRQYIEGLLNLIDIKNNFPTHKDKEKLKQEIKIHQENTNDIYMIFKILKKIEKQNSQRQTKEVCKNE